MKKEPQKFTVMRVRVETMKKFNYRRAKAVTSVNPKYQTQDEFLKTLLDMTS